MLPLLSGSPWAVGAASALAYAISMEDARLIARLRRGERLALAGLWEGWADAIWAVCLGMTSNHEEARAAFVALHRGLRDEARGWAPTVPVCCLLSATVCRQLALRLRLPQPDQRPRNLPPPSRPVAAHEIRAVVASIPGPERLVLLADLFFECPMESLAVLLAVPDENLRLARAAALGRLAPGGPGKGAAKIFWRLPCLACEDPPSDEAEALSELVEADPDLEARVAALAEARGLAHAVLASPAPELLSGTPLSLVEPPPPGDLLGAGGGLIVGLLAVLAVLVSSLVRPSPIVAFSAPLAAYGAAVGQATGFVSSSDPAKLSAAMRDAGVPPARAVVSDGAALRLKLTGGLATPSGAVVVYTLDGRPVTSQAVVVAPQVGRPDEAWEVRGVLLQAWQLGQTGLVVVNEPAIGRTRVFASALPPGQLMALLAYGLQIGAPL